MVRYSLMRIMLFLGCLLLGWLLGLRAPDQIPWLVIGAALVSMALSFWLLRGMREEFSERVAHSIDARMERRAAARSIDDDAEDREIDAGRSADR